MSISAVKELEAIKEQLLQEVDAIDVAIRIIKSKAPYTDMDAEPIRIKIEAPVNKPTIVKQPVNSNTVKASNVNSDIVLHSIIDANKFVKNATIKDDIAFFGLTDDSIRSAISYLKKAKKIVSKQVTKNNRDTYWGLTEWLDSNEDIKQEYMYDKSTLTSK